ATNPLGWLGGAVVALAVEELRRWRDGRRLRRLFASAPSSREAVNPDAQHSGLSASCDSSHGADRDIEERDVLMVRVLGRIAIDGVDLTDARPKAVETVAYLSLHPDGVDKDVWAAALWPERRMSPNSLNTTIWQARRLAGFTEDGARRLPATRGSRLRLGAGVTTDAARLEALRREGGKEALSRAMCLVRGKPCDGLEGEWVVLEGHASRLTELVVATALELAASMLDDVDPAAAADALRTGLEVSPFDERLYRMLLIAGSMSGNVGAVRAAFADLRAVLATDGGGVEPSCETLELYRRLTSAGDISRLVESAAESPAGRHADLAGRRSSHDHDRKRRVGSQYPHRGGAVQSWRDLLPC
ncbi:MAG TPA: BTAD domain-containing putative transcriptional regulator, partial [Acidimicrobiales bacterium]|nr:BTAD domain-containing putative transcriptional regulator [Acidimicrobiales bacterium]